MLGGIPMTRTFTATTWQEGEWFIAQCLEVDVASQGPTEEEALANLREALSLHFSPPLPTISPRVHEIEVEIVAA
jgi:predicted RNase H-like HicB family nuclease